MTSICWSLLRLCRLCRLCTERIGSSLLKRTRSVGCWKATSGLLLALESREVASLLLWLPKWVGASSTVLVRRKGTC